MAFTASEQEIYDFAKNSLPRLFFADPRAEEELNSAVKVFDAIRTQVAAYFTQSLILTSTDVPPDFLDQHARDRGTGRQASETNAALRDRLRNIEDAVTRPILIANANSILAAEALSEIAAMVEVRMDRAFFGTNDVDTASNGGEFFGTAPDMEFLPTTDPQIYSERVANASVIGPRIVDSHIVFSGSATAGNNGDFTITGLNGDRIQYQNGTGVAEADATAVWTFQKHDTSDNKLDGFAKSYFGRGFRMGLDRAAIIVIIPFGSTAGTQAAVLEVLRQKSGAGVATTVEFRQNP